MVQRPEVVEYDDGYFVLHWEPPNLVHLEVHGDLPAESTGRLFDRIAELVASQPFWLFEVDIKRLGSADSDTRRVGADRMSALPPYSMTVYGGSFGQSTVARLFFSAMDLLVRGRGNRHKVCSTPEESRAWLEAEAKRHRARSSPH